MHSISTHSQSQQNSEEERERRKRLLPLWIKLGGFLHVVLGVFFVVLAVLQVFTELSNQYGPVSFGYKGQLLEALPTFTWFLFYISNAVCAYGLLSGKDWGVRGCLVTGYIGLIVTVDAVFFNGQGINIDLILIIYPFYLVKLHRLKSVW